MNTIIRTHIDGRPLARPLEAIVGHDISEDDAEQMITSGDAEPGPERETPAAVYLLMPVAIRGFTYPAGSMLTVGAEIDERQCLALCRGMHNGPDGAIVSAPGGGIG